MTAHILRPAGVDGGRTHCRCGQPWPCPDSAEGRWSAFRDWLAAGHRAHDEIAVSCDGADLAATRLHQSGLAGAYKEALAKMDELEGQQ